MRAPRIVLLPALLLALLPPAVALEKCVSPAGKISYSEPPCPPGWKGSTVRGTTSSSAPASTPASAPASAAPARGAQKGAGPAERAGMGGAATGGKVEVRYYDVQGSDYESLVAALKARGGFHGQAEWKLSYQYEPRRAGRACSVASLTTTLDLVVDLPRWSPPPGAAPRLTSQWMRYVSALRRHKDGHLDIGREMEDAFRRSLAVTSERCERLESAIKSQYETLLEQHRARDRSYDVETAHGRTQGAEFTLR